MATYVLELDSARPEEWKQALASVQSRLVPLAARVQGWVSVVEELVPHMCFPEPLVVQASLWG